MGRLTARGGWASASRRPLIALVPLLVLFVCVTVAIWAAGVRTSDEGSYVAIAENLTEGRYSDPNKPNLWFGPGLPSVLAPLVVLDAPLAVLRLTGPLFLFLAAVFFYRLLDRYVSRGAALAGAYALGLYFPLYTTLPTVHSEPLALLLLVACLCFTGEFIHSGRRSALAAAGFALGWLAMTRVVFGWVVTLLLVVFGALWLVERLRQRHESRRRALVARRTLAVVGIAVAVSAPWLAFTFSESGRVWYWGNSGGSSLYWMASPFPGEHGSWYGGTEVRTNELLAPHRPFFASLRGKDPYEADAAMQRRALEYIRSAPDEYVENVLANISRMWFSMPYSHTEQKLSTLFYAVPNAVLLGGTVLCILMLFHARARLPGEFLPFIVLGIAIFGVSSLLAAYARMLFPIIPILLLIIVYTLSNHVQVKRDG
jgi:4-amino-4-deoxy-L-arabinose transferase-like glycosyltransferase